MALETETQGAFIFQGTTGPRPNKALTGANSASGYHRERFDFLPQSSLGQPLEMWP